MWPVVEILRIMLYFEEEMWHVPLTGAAEYDPLRRPQQPDEAAQLVSSVDGQNHAWVLWTGRHGAGSRTRYQSDVRPAYSDRRKITGAMTAYQKAAYRWSTKRSKWLQTSVFIRVVFYNIFNFIRRRSIQQQKEYMKKRERQKKE